MKLIKNLLAITCFLAALVAPDAAAVIPPATGYYSITYDTSKGTATIQLAGDLAVAPTSSTLKSGALIGLNGITGLISTTYGVSAATGVFSSTVTMGDIITKGPWVDVRAYGAKGDGTTDDTTALQNALNSVRTAGGIVFFPSGTYLYSTPLRIGSSVTVEGAGRGLSIIKQKNNNMPGGGQDDGAAFINYNFSLSTSTDQNIEIRNLTVDGNYQNNPDIAAGSAGGISMTYATDVRIINVEIANVDGYGGIYYGAQNLSDSGGYLSRNLPGITVSECFIHDSTSTTAGGSYGSGMFLSAQQSVHLDVHDNFLLNNRTAIYLEDSASQADIHDNHITNTSNGPTGSGVSVEQGNGPLTQVNVHHNTISYMSYGVIVGGNGIRAVIVDGNIISTCTNAGIYVATPGNNNALGSYIKISNNLVRDTLSGPGIQVGSLSSTVTVSGNLCYDEKVTRTQTYGLFIDSFAKNVHVDASNQFDNNLTGPINNLSTTTTLNYCAGGKCGFNTYAPAYAIHVASGSIYAQYSLLSATMSATQSASFATASGSVNIGTTAATTNGKLQVYTGASGATAHVNADEIVAESDGNAGISIITPNTATGSIFFGDPQDATIGQISYNHSTNALAFQTAGGNRMNVLGGGNIHIVNSLGIGNAAPGTALDVTGQIRQSDTLNCTLGLKSDASGTITGCVASDRRLKSGIRDLSYMKLALDRLRPRLYRWKDGTSGRSGNAGFVAQEVEQVFPQAVAPAGNGMKGVDPNAILALLVKEVQELRKRVAALEAGRVP